MGYREIGLALNLPDGSLSARARLFLYALCYYADANGRCWPDNATLMRVAATGRAGFFRSLKELGDAGLLEYKAVKRENYHYEFTVRFDRLEKVIDKQSQFDTRAPKLSTNSLNLILEGAPESQIDTEKSIKLRLESQIDTQQNSHNIYNNNSSVSKSVIRTRGRGRVDNLEAAGGENAEKSEVKKMPAGADAGTLLSDYKLLVRRYGWKPRNQADVIGIWNIAFEMGMSKDEADEFVRYNGARGWAAVNKTCSVRMLCHRWISNWRKREPGGMHDERERRKAEAREERERKIRRAIEAEQEEGK